MTIMSHDLSIRPPSFDGVGHKKSDGFTGLGMNSSVQLTKAVKAPVSAQGTQAKPANDTSYDRLREENIKALKNALDEEQLFTAKVSTEPDEYGGYVFVIEIEESGERVEFPPRALAEFFRGNTVSDNLGQLVGAPNKETSSSIPSDVFRNVLSSTLREGSPYTFQLISPQGQQYTLTAQDVRQTLQLSIVA